MIIIIVVILIFVVIHGRRRRIRTGRGGWKIRIHTIWKTSWDSSSGSGSSGSSSHAIAVDGGIMKAVWCRSVGCCHVICRARMIGRSRCDSSCRCCGHAGIEWRHGCVGYFTKITNFGYTLFFRRLLLLLLLLLLLSLL